MNAEALQEVNRLWTIVRAFSNAAHDINNALQIIAGSAELLEARELDPMLRRRFETIRQQSGRAAVSVERLLAYSRDAPVSECPLDLASEVEGAVAMRAFSLRRAGITVVVDRSDPNPFWMLADRNRILQALLNLLLLAEAAVKSCHDSALEIQLDRGDRHVTVQMTACTRPGATGVNDSNAARSPAVSDVTTGTEVWTVAQLASLQRGSFDIQDNGAGLTLRLSFPSCAPP
jgi:signal transduction histidine kinase